MLNPVIITHLKIDTESKTNIRLDQCIVAALAFGNCAKRHTAAIDTGAVPACLRKPKYPLVSIRAECCNKDIEKT